ncbi:hypothetical protein DFH06DRAFT_1150445 [Mycena polygramma]|nr:hypothetical protein DFH06DRAFT_1150445 [Mycena polygramma]
MNKCGPRSGLDPDSPEINLCAEVDKSYGKMGGLAESRSNWKEFEAVGKNLEVRTVEMARLARTSQFGGVVKEDEKLVLPSVVLCTWSRTLLAEDELPKDWLREPKVLVGIVPKRSQRSPSPDAGG